MQSDEPRPTSRTRKLLLFRLLGTTQQTRPPRSNKTRLLSLGRVSRDGRGFTDMLVVTTTVGVVDGVHGNTTGLGPRVALDRELVLGTRGLCLYKPLASRLVHRRSSQWARASLDACCARESWREASD